MELILIDSVSSFQVIPLPLYENARSICEMLPKSFLLDQPGSAACSSEEAFPGIVHIFLGDLNVLFGEVAEPALEF